MLRQRTAQPRSEGFTDVGSQLKRTLERWVTVQCGRQAGRNFPADAAAQSDSAGIAAAHHFVNTERLDE